MNGAAATEKAQKTVLKGSTTRNLVAFLHESTELHDENDHEDGVNQRTKESAKENGHSAEQEVDNGVDTASIGFLAWFHAVGLPIVAHTIEQLSKGNTRAAQSVPKDAFTNVLRMR